MCILRGTLLKSFMFLKAAATLCVPYLMPCVQHWTPHVLDCVPYFPGSPLPTSSPLSLAFTPEADYVPCVVGFPRFSLMLIKETGPDLKECVSGTSYAA